MILHFDDEIISNKEYEMKSKGYDFITNFGYHREELYRRASEIHNLDYKIVNEAYDNLGRTLYSHMAFYVDSNVNDLSDFWRTFERLKDKLKGL